mmetsp:Transcript_19885/g.54720  ORF Transcript_19885/g.54720 Transcript_19885/m.54720 type:complete len:276 (-) Transcript_19885:887-1714(-)
MPRLAVDNVRILIHADSRSLILREARPLLGSTDAKPGLDWQSAPALESAEEAAVGLEVALHQDLVIHDDVDAPAQEDHAIQSQAGNDCRLAFTCAHLGDQGPHVLRCKARDVLQANEHAHHLRVVGQHQEVELLLHDLRPREEDGPEALHQGAGTRRWAPQLLQNALHVFLTAQVQSGRTNELAARAVLRLSGADVLQDPLLVLQAAVRHIGQGQVLLVQEAEEEDDRVQRRQDVPELRDTVAFDDGLRSREEELVVGRLGHIHEAHTLGHVRKI